jgi:hypothetical protein
MSVRSASSRRSVGSSRTADILSELENAPNPFSMPSDEEVFVLREEERHRKLQERERLQQLKVHEKTTWGTRQGAATLKDMGVDMYSFDVPADDDEEQAEAPKKISRAPKDKETMSEFIAKKREMFLVQMSLNTKHEEIARLDQRAHARDLALKESEEMLQNDEKRFEDFINENDKRANHAMIRADREVKAKQERLQEIKRLDNEIKRVESEISKVEDKLDECKVTKEFLLECTAEDWHETQALKIAEERTAEIIREEDDAAAEAKAAEEARKAEEGIEDEPDPELEKMSDEARAKKEQEEKAALQAARAAHREEVYERVKAEITDDDIPMFFTTPQQLIDHFKRLEEDNLFLMQQCQDTEVMFEEVREKHDAKDRQMTAEADELKASMKTLRDQINTEQQRCNALEARLRQGEEDAENDESERQDLLQTEEVRKVFVLCYPEQKEDRLDTIEMLTLIEKKMDSTFAELDRMEAAGLNLEEKEKMKQKERRSEARLLQIEQQRIAQERRVEASRKKAMEPIKKKTGKPIMFRSAPPQRKEQVEDDQEDDQDELDRQYFFS